MLTEPSSLSQLISTTHKDKPPRMLVESPVLKSKELLTNQLPLPLPTVCKRKKIKLLPFMIWEEEHSISQFSKSVKVLLKLKPLTEIPLVVVRILMVLSKDTYSNNSKSNQVLMYQRIKLPFKDSEKLLKKLKSNFLNQPKLK